MTSSSVSLGSDDVPIVWLRHYGRWAVAAVIIVVLAAIVYAFSQAKISYSVTAHYLFNGQILSGVYHTVLISIISMATALVLGTLAAVIRNTPNVVARWAVGFYVWLFRGTPTLVQLLIWYNLSLIFPSIEIPGLFHVQTNTVMTPLVAAYIGLSFHVGAYVAEIARSGISAISQGQSYAASSLGMTPAQTMRRVTLPQALPIMLPPLGNQFIALLKYTSLAYVIQYHELLYQTISAYTVNLRVMALLFVAALWYLAMTTVATFGQRVLERRLSPRARAAAVQAVEPT